MELPAQTLSCHGNPPIDVGPVVCQNLVIRLPLQAAFAGEGHEVTILLHKLLLDVVEDLDREIIDY